MPGPVKAVPEKVSDGRLLHLFRDLTGGDKHAFQSGRMPHQPMPQGKYYQQDAQKNPHVLSPQPQPGSHHGR